MHVRAASNARSVELAGKIIAGPETAAKLGVPVGAEIDLGTLAYWNRDPIRRFCGRLTRRRR